MIPQLFTSNRNLNFPAFAESMRGGTARLVMKLDG